MLVTFSCCKNFFSLTLTCGSSVFINAIIKIKSSTLFKRDLELFYSLNDDDIGDGTLLLRPQLDAFIFFKRLIFSLQGVKLQNLMNAAFDESQQHILQ